MYPPPANRGVLPTNPYKSGGKLWMACRRT
nr:MAG TPA: hypothetical protein [Inoviridae sp.]